MLRLICTVICLSLLAPGAMARELKVYFFGNSLINHVSDTPETTVPYWLSRMAQADGNSFRSDGQFGFMRDHAADDRPRADWRIDGADQAWGRQYRNFADVGYDVVVTNPANFIQYQPPDRPYDGDNPTGASPLSATLALFDRMNGTEGIKRFVIYEGWADMGPFVRGFPPSTRQLARYHAFNAGEYHDWYQTFVADLRAARPDYTINMIPVARVLAQTLADPQLDGIDVRDLYLDDAPHGTATLYLLAAAITYVGLFHDAPPLDMVLPDSIHPLVRENWGAIVKSMAIDTGLIKVTTNQQTSAREVAAKLPGDIDPVPPENPPLGTNLAPISDWSTQVPFIDLMKTARPWTGHLPGQWGGWTFEDLADGGYLDQQGWVWGIPPELSAVEALILTDMPAAMAALEGRYRVRWEGQGNLSLTGRARVISQTENEAWFDYRPGDGLVGLKITDTDPQRTGDYIRNISVIREELIPAFEAGQVFNPDFIDLIADMRALRFMDWMRTNNSTQVTWGDRPQISDFSYGWRGVPVEVMLSLANGIGADPWMTLPHMADDTYVASFALTVRDTLRPDLKLHVEYSNEVWNFIFDQAKWAQEQAVSRWGGDIPDDAWMQFYGVRAAEVMEIISQAFGDEATDRLVRVVSTHTGWPGLERAILNAPLHVAAGGSPPREGFDAYAVTGYFGHGLGTDDGAPVALSWVVESRAEAEAAGRALGLTRAALSEHVRAHLFDTAIPKAIAHLRQGDLGDLLDDTLPYHAKVARDAGLALVAYEGGTHVTGVGEWANDEVLTNFLIAVNYSGGMGALYDKLLADWRTVGGTLFMHYNDLGMPSKWGSWGAWRFIGDENPRSMALDGFNRDTDAWWEDRAATTFQGDLDRR
ncbi:calcium-binding protein [Shimia biformata]|uniref:calcium-binding protein n=1 Tax=Shimia biformata TaxID=1294299 RepID=UPI001950A0E0|nr:calcium-binding protein [Shimia biformata]